VKQEHVQASLSVALVVGRLAAPSRHEVAIRSPRLQVLEARVYSRTGGFRERFFQGGIGRRAGPKVHRRKTW